jgi:hypothetical protein
MRLRKENLGRNLGAIGTLVARNQSLMAFMPRILALILVLVGFVVLAGPALLLEALSGARGGHGRGVRRCPGRFWRRPAREWDPLPRGDRRDALRR